MSRVFSGSTTSSPSNARADTWLVKRATDSVPRLQVNSSRPKSAASTVSTTPCSTSPIHGQVSEGTSMPTVRLLPRARPTAPELGT